MTSKPGVDCNSLKYAVAKRSPSTVGSWLWLKNGATATLRTGVRLADAQTATITGTAGILRLSDPWALGARQTIELDVVGEGRREIDVRPIISHALPLARADEAFRLASDRTTACKVHLTFGAET